MIVGVADTAAVLTVAEDVEVLEAEDLLLAGPEVVTVKCLMPPAVTAAKIAKFLLDPQTVNRFTAVTVLRKWEMAEEVIQGGLTTGIVHPKHMADPIWAQLMPNLIKS
jgi:hypothetical protein